MTCTGGETGFEELTAATHKQFASHCGARVGVGELHSLKPNLEVCSLTTLATTGLAMSL